MTTYAEKLKDPRWQRKRLEVMQAAGFACEKCRDTSETLHVHHKQYFKGREPWEYETAQLACLCEPCHEGQHDEEDLLHLVCSFLPLDGPCSREAVASLVAGYGATADDDDIPGAAEILQTRSGWDPHCEQAGVVARALQPMNIHDLIDLSNFAVADPKGFCAALVEFLRGRAGTPAHASAPEA